MSRMKEMHMKAKCRRNRRLFFFPSRPLIIVEEESALFIYSVKGKKGGVGIKYNPLEEKERKIEQRGAHQSHS